MSSEGERPIDRIEDPGEYNQRRRIQDINEARAYARTVYNNLGLKRDIDDADFFRAVKSYVMEVEWLIIEHGGEKYTNQPLGPIEIEPPKEIKELEDWRELAAKGSLKHRPVGDVSVGPKQVYINGLTNGSIGAENPSFVELSPVVAEEWSVPISRKHKKDAMLTRLGEAAVPANVSFQAFQLTNQFLEEVGLDARVQDEIDKDPNPY